MFDRLGDFLRDYIDEDEQDIFSNPEEETVENSNTTSTQENFSENVKQESYQTKTENKPKQECTSETQSKTQKQTQSENKKTESKFGNQDTYQNFFTSNNSNKTNSANTSTQKPKVTPKVFVPFELHPDFKTLCVIPGTSLEECKASYKSLLKKYHPDRFANDEKKQKEATEITSSITTAFNRIKTWYEANLPK
jgi:hypothetical protein